MKQRQTWLLALLSILMLVMTPCLATAGSSGNLEVGGVITGVEDNTARVNEYVKNRTDDGGSPSIKLEAEGTDGKSAFDLDIDLINGDIYSLETEYDFARILKLDISLDSFQHWKDHETLGQMGATARDDIGGSQPNVTTDKIYADMIEENTPAIKIGGATLIDPDTLALAYDPAEAWAEEVSNDYIVTRRELKGETDLTLPMLPNIVFHAGLRIETREGMEQAIGLSKCNGCHVSAKGKEIDERTEEFTLGATGKFGIVTVDYEYLTRDFEEQADAPTRWYVNTAPDAPASGDFVKESGLLYGQGEYEFGKTPDSEKDSHMLKARVDLDSKTSISASYVSADIESSKTGETGVFEIDDTLTSEYNGFNGKLATAFGEVRLSVHGGVYEIEGPEYTVTFPPREENFGGTNPIDEPNHTLDTEQHFHSAESREVTEFGIDAVYRLAKATTLRLGYGYEEVSRNEEELGETETHTLKAAVKTRFNKNLSGRASYEYQDISDPFVAHNATGIAQGDPDFYDPVSGLAALNTAQFNGIDGNIGGWVYYWNSVYPSRALDATNQPDTVHEIKLSSTWSPQANLAATFYLRAHQEENDDVHYEQTTFVPGVNLWYAPSNKLNLSMSYNFNNQDTENRACVGWYHG